MNLLMPQPLNHHPFLKGGKEGGGLAHLFKECMVCLNDRMSCFEFFCIHVFSRTLTLPKEKKMLLVGGCGLIQCLFRSCSYSFCFPTSVLHKSHIFPVTPLGTLKFSVAV